MPIVTLKSPYQTWRGKDQTAGGNVLYPVDGRMVARPNFIPDNPNSPLQIFTRATLANVSQAFTTLTPAQLQDWTIKAQDFVRTDPDGNTYKPGPMSYFISVNWYRALA